MAGLKVLQLINDNTATALSYSVFRRKDVNATAQNIMFYDMGSGSTMCTIVTYQTVKTKEAGMQPCSPSCRSMGWGLTAPWGV